MDRIPFVSAFYFFQQYSPSGKKLFIGLYIAILLSCALWLWASFSPETQGLQPQQGEKLYSAQIQAGELSSQNVNTSWALTAYSRFDLPQYGLIYPPTWAVWIFILFQTLAWSALLTATSKLKPYWNLVPSFLFISWLGLSGIAQLIVGQDPWYLITGLISLCFGALLFFYQQKGRNIPILLQFVTYFTLLSFCIGAIRINAGFTGIFQLVTNTFPLIYLFACAVLLYVAKEPLHLIILLATNHKDSKKRIPLWAWIGFPVLLLLFLILLEARFTGFICPEIAGISATWIAIIAVLALPFTAQAIYHNIKHVYIANIGFTLALLGSALLCVSFWGFSLTSGNLLMQHQSDRIITGLFPVMLLLQMIYVGINFYKLIKTNQPLFFVIMMPTKIRFLIVWLTFFVCIGILEGQKSWKTFQLLAAQKLSFQADALLIAGDLEAAGKSYYQANLYASGDTKTLYNSGRLLLKPGTSSEEPLQLLLACGEHYPSFIAGDLAYAEYQRFTGRTAIALPLLKKRTSETVNPLLVNYLAYLYTEQNLPDSAILCLRDAYTHAPDFMPTQNNLALIYLQNRKPKYALPFLIECGKKLQEYPEGLVNIRYYQLNYLKQDSELQFTEFSSPPEGASFALKLNEITWQLCAEDHSINPTWMQALESEGEKPEILQLQLIRTFTQDSIFQSLSRYQYLINTWPAEKGITAHNLGALYWQSNCPEMAVKYFEIAAQENRAKDYIHAGQALAMQARSDSAIMLINRARLFGEKYSLAAAKESALLLFAFGQKNYAQLDWDFNNATFDDWMRASRYASAVNHFEPLLESLRYAQALDSLNPQPHLLLGNYYLKLKSYPQAIEALKDGISISGKHPELLFALISVYNSVGDFNSSKIYLQQLKNEFPQSEEYKIYQFSQFLQKPTNSDSLLSLLNAELLSNPLDSVRLNLAIEYWSTTGDAFQGAQYLSKIIQINDQQPNWWIAFAKLSRKAGLAEQSGYAILRAIQLIQYPAEKLSLQKEFAEVILQYNSSINP